ncbi:MAG: DUF559 domain-containing protein [Clostridia bacterium]|nr:DUF559 domain-containing protein [Clostridia bacterium]
MNEVHNKKLTPISKVLRKNMTPEEKHLWYDFLKKLPVPVHRQKVIDSYVVDFYIAKPRLIIELDGAGHRTEKGEAEDKLRDFRLKEKGFQVLRFTNKDIHNHFSSVCNEILSKISPLNNE